MLESERWERLRQLTEGEPAPLVDVDITWWKGSRHDVEPSQSVVSMLTAEAVPIAVADLTAYGRVLFAEFDRLPTDNLDSLHMVGWPEAGGVVAVEGGGQRVASMPITHKRPRNLTAYE